jgi:predicted O-methyltransferase YrrM
MDAAVNPYLANNSNVITTRLSKAISFLPLLAWLRITRRLSQPEAAVDFVINHKTLSALQVRSELLEMANLISAMKPKAVLEIGTALGGTLLLMCKLSDPGATIVSLDLPKQGFAYRRYRVPIFRALSRKGQKLHLLTADSHSEEVKSHVAGLLDGRSLDVLFIDGDHSYQGVRSDFEMYSPFVRKGGMVIFHDIVEHSSEKHCDVNRFWNEIKGQYSHREIIENAAQGWAGVGVLYL